MRTRWGKRTAARRPDPAAGTATGPDAAAGPSGPDRQRAGLVRRLGRILTGDADALGSAGTPLNTRAATHLVQAARVSRAQARLAQGLTTGESVEAALLASMRELLRAEEWYLARSLADGLRGVPGAEHARALGLALASHKRGWDELAWDHLATVPTEVVARHLAWEAVEICFLTGHEESRRKALEIADAHESIPVAMLVETAARFLVGGDVDTARRLVAEVERRGTDGLPAIQQRQLAVLPLWLEHREPPAVPEGAVSLGVIDYHHSDQKRASRNVGDYVQTLAMLGHLARFSDCSFTGEDGLGEFVTDLQGRVRPELRSPGAARPVHLMPVSRDFSNHDPVPPGTWMPAFGWHLHSLFGIGYDFPYHPNIRPLFVSFHINQPQMLTEDAIVYLRRYGPVGCRDWTTVDLLMSAGVDAFFTGCLTSTVGTVFPERAEVGGEATMVGLIDVAREAGAKVKRRKEWITHSSGEFRDASVIEGLRAAQDLLDRYQRRYARVITSRLHSYLPATALGVPATFLPKNSSDVRFDGLFGMEPQAPQFVAMRDGIMDLMADVVGLILAGADEDTVYARWRELAAPRVAEARERAAAAAALDPVEHLDLTALLQAVHEDSRAYGPHDRVDPATVTDVALSLDEQLKAQLPVTLEALVGNASGPLRLWITCRGLDASYQRWIADAFPAVPITFLPCDHVDYGAFSRMIPHTTITTIDRLLLPEMLPELDRLTYIDIDALVLGDVCELARTELGGAPLAARGTRSSAVRVWRKAGNALPTDRAHELRRIMAARHPYTVTGLNAGVLVLDLARMRRDGFSETFLPWVGRYGLNDQDVLIAYAGPERVDLDPRWNSQPIKETVRDPAIVHYLGPTKPWRPLVAPDQHLWQRYQSASEARVGPWVEPAPEGSRPSGAH